MAREVPTLATPEKRIIELGSRDINGSARRVLRRFKPEFYVGVDAASGRGVDVVWGVESINRLYPKGVFDLVVATELLEHIHDWRRAIENMVYLCADDGYILITTRSEGFPLHDYPEDHWRFSLDDMCAIFGTYHTLREDPEQNGVLCLIRKRPGYALRPLDDIKLYNINSGERE
jgi:SAM-dependent methyltransferase